MAADRLYNGQLLQAATTEVRLSTPEGFDFLLKTWEDLKLEYGAESKLVNNTDGSPAGYTTEPVVTSAGIKMRLEEWNALVLQHSQQVPDRGILQTVFILSALYGNSLASMRKDVGVVKFQKVPRDVGKSGALMVDCPMLLLDFVENGIRPIQFPV